jgi:glycosyltransferase involved in cell wall biosynthesis
MLAGHIQKTHRKLQAGEFIEVRSQRSTQLDKEKILLVGMADSSHFQQWLEVLQQEFPEKKILVFPSDRPHFTRVRLKGLKRGRKSTRVFQLFHNGHLNFITYYVLDNLLGLRWRAYFLARLIIRHKPAVIHFHEMQHGAYIFNLIVSYKGIPNNSRNVISTWGSDLNLYSWLNEHKSQISSCLRWVDVLTAERQSELKDAQRLGFIGEFRAPVYITLGHTIEELTEVSKPSSRTIILVKGYQDNPGRALNALCVVSKLKNELKDFKVLVYSASESVRAQVEILRNRELMDISVLPRVTYGQMQEYFGKTRVSISLAMSDGLPGALVEAMQAGAFPIQSENSAAGEFLIQGKSGFIVDPWDLDSIQEALRQALSDNVLVDSASTINRKILHEKYSMSEGVTRLREIYL